MSEQSSFESNNSADVLLALIGKIRNAGRKELGNNGGNINALLKSVSSSLGYENTTEFVFRYYETCNHVLRDLENIEVAKPEIKKRWISKVKEIRGTFEIQMGPAAAKSLFDQRIERNEEVLYTLSERIQKEGGFTASKEKVTQAFDAMRDAVQEFCKSEGISDRFKRLLMHYMQQIELAYKQYDDFGEEQFWKVYKETFATFVQLHPQIMGAHNRESIVSKVKIAANSMVVALSVSADAATLTTGAFLFLDRLST
ncbi:hypothetical protein [uncultured Cohaesibacter sp.]|uniref:hypothetical protein n=1 Tax=uncultured Cohaesibacter sp. TaxID=1002546 RepID=UPI0029C820AD|nr:hypothetical protein [uncultured Cohaesibacter sp.]